MIKLYKTNEAGVVNEINNIEKNCWINVINPTSDEIKSLSVDIGIDGGFLTIYHLFYSFSFL